MIDNKKRALSFSDLIEALEHIEVDQLHSDIPANVSAELKHIKRNLSAILAFLPAMDSTAEPALRESVRMVRQECMSLHVAIVKMVLLQFFRLSVVVDSQYPAVIAAQYQKLAQTMCQTCQMLSPQLTEQLSGAL